MAKKISKISIEVGKLIPILRKHDVVKADIFGSFAKGEQKKGSDIDIIIEFKGRKSLLDLAHLELELEKALGRRADVLTYNSIHPLLRKSVLKEQIKVI